MNNESCADEADVDVADDDDVQENQWNCVITNFSNILSRNSAVESLVQVVVASAVGLMQRFSTNLWLIVAGKYFFSKFSAILCNFLGHFSHCKAISFFHRSAVPYMFANEIYVRIGVESTHADWC